VGTLDGDRDVSWSFKFLTNELRRHRQLSAYIYTELTDVEWEYNGFLNYDRTPKEFGYHPTIVNQGDTLPMDAAPISRVEPGQPIAVDVLSSHFSRRRREGVSLHWLYSAIDTLGTEHPHLVRGRAKIPFTHHRVELARRIELRAPETPMLCTLAVAAVTSDGQTVASNFIQHLVGPMPPPQHEERRNSLILRKRVHEWDHAGWSGGHAPREESAATAICYGYGSGYFQWDFHDEQFARLGEIRRVRILFEVSSRRNDFPQTDSHRYATFFELVVNGVPVHRGLLPDHPHDTRGALSYLRGGKGAYGYLIRTTIEENLLERVAAAAGGSTWHVGCHVPENTAPTGGLTVYDSDAGRYPIGPTLILEREQGGRRRDECRGREVGLVRNICDGRMLGRCRVFRRPPRRPSSEAAAPDRARPAE